MTNMEFNSIALPLAFTPKRSRFVKIYKPDYSQNFQLWQ